MARSRTIAEAEYAMRRLILVVILLVTATLAIVGTGAAWAGPTVTPGAGGGFNLGVTGSQPGNTGGGGGGTTGGGGGGTTSNSGGGGGFTEVPIECIGPGISCNTIGEPQGPVPSTPSIVDIATAVQVAVTAANIQPIVIGITPEDVPGRTGLVGMPTWLWVKNPSENTIGPVQRTVTTGAVTVNLTGVLTSIMWNMGDGYGLFPCAGPPVAPYVPYTDVMLNLPSPTCGYYYRRSSIDQPGGVWRVSATSMWLIFWSVATPTATVGGVIPLAPTARTQIRTGEMQVLVQPVP